MSKAKSALNLALKILVAVGLITYLVKTGHLDPKDLWDLMTPLNVSVALILVGLNNFFCALRWVWLLRSTGMNMPLGYGFSLFLIGVFFNHALPGAVSGDVVRGFYLVRDHPERKLDGALSIFIDRILGLYCFFILTLAAALWDYEFVVTHEKIRWVALLSLIVFLGMTVTFSIAFSQRLSHRLGLTWLKQRIRPLRTVVDALQRFGRRRQAIVLSVAVSLFSQVFTMAFFYLFAQVTNEPGVTWAAVLFAVPMGFLVTAVPISPAGVGVGQVAFLYLFQTYLDNPQSQFGATAITAFQLAVVCWALVGAALYLKRRKPREFESMVSTAEMA